MSTEKSSQEKTPIYKKWWFWVIIIIVLIIGGGAASGSKEPKKISENDGTSQQTSDENQTFKVGDTIAVDGKEIIVSNVQRDYSPSEYIKASDGKEFIRVNVEIKNASDDKTSYNILEWQIEDADGALESVDIMGSGADSTSLSSGELTAGGKKNGTLVFQVPKGQTGLKLHYKPLLSTVSEMVIEL